MKEGRNSRLQFLIVVCALLLYTGVRAQLTFVTNNGAITITGYTGSGAVVIPSTTNGLPVTTIAGNAFHLKDQVPIITLPNSITNIGSGAFRVCFALTNINIPGSVLSIGDFVLDGNSDVSTVTLGDAASSIESISRTRTLKRSRNCETALLIKPPLWRPQDHSAVAPCS